MVFDEPLGWKGKVHQHVITDGPRPFPGISKLEGIVVADPQSFQVPHFSAWQFPLVTTRLRLIAVFQTAGLRFAPAPEEDPQSPDDPTIEFLNQFLAETYPKVVQPTGYEPVQFVDDALKRNAPGSAGDFPHLVFEASECFRVDA